MAINKTAGPALRAPAPAHTYPCIANTTAHILSNPIQAFAAAMMARKIIPPAEIVPDGQLHRCAVKGKAGKTDASYCLHLDGLPAGGFKNWCDGLGWENWHAERAQPLTPAERSALAAHIDAMRRQRETDKRQRHADAAAAAAIRWAAATLASDAHPYLQAKGVKPHSLRSEGAVLLVPMRDAAGNLHSLQEIHPDGFKHFMTAGRVKGCYHAIGKPIGKLMICEGYATGATIHEDTGHAVACAFFAGNLLDVAKAMRAEFPGLTLILAADDDWQTAGNPGLTAARAAAAAVGGLLMVPDFTSMARGPKDTDWNDWARLRREAHTVEVSA